jgi:hypothetical protein
MSRLPVKPLVDQLLSPPAVLSCQEDRSNGEIAQQLRVTPQTVGKWRTCFARQRLDGLLDEPRPGAPA